MKSLEIDKFKQAVETLVEKIGRKRKRYLIACYISVIVITTLSAIFVFMNSDGLLTGLTFFVVLMAIVPCLMFYHALNYFYRKAGKKLLTDAISEASSMTYYPDGVMTLAEVFGHKILPLSDEDEHEDGFSGMYHDVMIDLQEMRLTDIEKRQNRATNNHARQNPQIIEYDVFWGLVIRLRLKRAMEGHTVVMPKSRLQSALRTKFTEFQKVNIVSPQWKKQYDVLSTDQIEARVILDPAFIERFMDAARIFKAKWMEVSFKDHEILFAVHRGKDLFEPPPLWQAVTRKNLEKVTRELEIVFDIIDTLKLNKQIGF